MKKNFIIANKKVTIYSCDKDNSPILYLNSFSDEADNIYQVLQKDTDMDFTLVVISKLDWNHDMSPWKIPPISKDSISCTGGANDYLKLLIDEIIPTVENQLSNIAWRGLIGYSLAGLFAIYALYKTNFFTRIGSISGSLWFPNFKEYIFSNEMKQKPEKLYFSLGNKENKTSNPYLKSVKQNTIEIESYYNRQDIDTILQFNQGNHIHNSIERTVVGIKWLLGNKSLIF